MELMKLRLIHILKISILRNWSKKTIQCLSHTLKKDLKIFYNCLTIWKPIPSWCKNFKNQKWTTIIKTARNALWIILPKPRKRTRSHFCSCCQTDRSTSSSVTSSCFERNACMGLHWLGNRACSARLQNAIGRKLQGSMQNFIAAATAQQNQLRFGFGFPWKRGPRPDSRFQRLLVKSSIFFGCDEVK